jgi:hypothetical protein
VYEIGPDLLLHLFNMRRVRSDELQSSEIAAGYDFVFRGF